MKRIVIAAVVFAASHGAALAQSRQGPPCLIGSSCVISALTVTGSTTLAGMSATTGAFSGEITATASGTGLAVTNAATVGGTLGAGPTTIDGALTIAPSSLQSIIQSSTANGGSGNLFLEVPNNGLLRVTVDGVTAIQIDTEVKPEVTLAMLASGVVPNSNAYTGQIFENTNYSGGGSSVSNKVYGNLFQANTDAVNAPNGFSELGVNDFAGGGAMVGPRSAVNAQVNLESTSGNNSGTGVAYIAGQFNAIGSANDNGTSGAYKSVVFGLNAVAHLTPSATYWQGLVAMELDVLAETGSSILNKFGLSITQVTTPGTGDQVQGSANDAALLFANQQIGGPYTVGWKNVIQFGETLGEPPCGSGPCTLVYAIGPSGGTFNATNGIDIHNVIFSGNSWNDGYIVFDGAGAANLNAGTALSLSATDGFVALPFTAGIPTGAPAANDNCAIDTTNGYINCYYGGAWHKIAFANGAG